MNFRPMLFTGIAGLVFGLIVVPRATPQKPPTQQAAIAANVIEAIEFRGARRMPQDTLRALIASKPGDVYRDEAVRRDFAALWDTHRFDDIHVETGKGARGGVVMTFTVIERQ
jgi:outer membrane protein insertion porin family